METAMNVEGKQMSDDGCFELDLATIEGLVSRGFLADSARHDMDAVEQALQAFLRYEFGGKHPANPSPANPIGQIPIIPPVPTVIVTEHGQRALNELVLEGILIALLRSGVLSAPAAVSVIDGVIETAVRRQLFGGAVEGARFARESLLYEFGRLGLVSSSR
jgi:hypothetical protein